MRSAGLANTHPARASCGGARLRSSRTARASGRRAKPRKRSKVKNGLAPRAALDSTAVNAEERGARPFPPSHIRPTLHRARPQKLHERPRGRWLERYLSRAKGKYHAAENRVPSPCEFSGSRSHGVARSSRCGARDARRRKQQTVRMYLYLPVAASPPRPASRAERRNVDHTSPRARIDLGLFFTDMCARGAEPRPPAAPSGAFPRASRSPQGTCSPCAACLTSRE